MRTITKLIDEVKMSKYRVAKLVGVSWNTVQLWYKGVYEPNKRHQRRLNAILKKEV